MPGRNGQDLNLTLFYNSAVWMFDQANNVAMFNADRDFPGYGFRLGFGYLELDYNSGAYILTEGDGTKRQLTFTSGDSFDSSDSSYTTYSNTTHYLKYKNGTQVLYEQFPTMPGFFRPIRIYDTDGNYILISYVSGKNQEIDHITDTLGRIIQFDYDAGGKLWKIRQGTFRTYVTFTWSQWPLNYNFSLSAPGSPTSGTSINVLTGLTYANSTGYSFQYGDWGIVSVIKSLSSNGTVRSAVAYNYPTAATQLSSHPTYTQQYVCDRPAGTCDASSGATWTFAVAKTNGQVSQSTITDPSGTKTITSLYTSGWNAGLVSSTEIRDTSNALLRGTTNTWASDTTTYANPRLSRVVTTLGDTNPNRQAKTEFDYTSYGNVSQLREYDWYLVLKRTTSTDYLTDSNYILRHILDRPIKVQVRKPDSTVVARTDFAYDGTSFAGVSGATNHDDVYYSSSFRYRGKVTSITRYENAAAGSGGVTRHFYYDSVGNLVTAELDCCSQRQWAYTSTTQYAYPNSVTSGPTGTQYTISSTYNFATGTVNSATDENGKTTSYGYDNIDRVTSVTLPNSVVVSTSFGDSAATPTVTTSSTANSAVTLTSFDGLGRSIKQQLQNSTTLVSTRDTVYDALNRPTQTSNPYAPGETPQNTIYQYDALGRQKFVTPPGSAGSYQYDYLGERVTITDPAGNKKRAYSDALGRLVRVDEPGYGSSTPGTGSVTVSGSEQLNPGQLYCALYDNESGECISWANGPDQYDFGTISVTVNGTTEQVFYGQGNTPASIAAAIAAAFNADPVSPATGVAGGPTVTFTARQAGSQTNYGLSTQVTWDSTNFASASFSVSQSGPSFTGGADGGTGTITIETPLITLYAYNELDKLTVVTQGEQTRTYTYDSMGRLKSVTTPETNNTASSYTYTDFDAVLTRTDPRGVVTTYAYDPLHRLTQISYNVGTSGVPATPTVLFTYGVTATQNNNNRLLTMADGTGSETYQYNTMGHVSRVDKVLDGNTYTLQYAYNLAGDLQSITYPSAHIVTQAYDPIGRLQTVSSNGTNYLSVGSPSQDYNAAGQLKKFTYGNGVVAEFGYNNRLQVSSIRYSNGGATDLLNLAYDYGTSNNGQIRSIKYYTSPGVEDPTKSVNLQYDEWARLKSGSTTNLAGANTWALQWGYDRYGNRRTQTLTGGTASVTQPQLTISHTTNQIADAGYSYLENGVNAGNMTNDALHTYRYDAENRMVQVDSGALNFTYDGNSLRVKTVVGSTTTRCIYSGSRPIAEYANGSLVAEYIYAGGHNIATLSSTGAPTYLHRDHLSTRVETGSSGGTTRTYGHLPFGETWYESGTSEKWKFTTYERDGGSGVDYAIARQFGSRIGRFNSPDPIGGGPSDPQSLNRYAYSRNDPINLVDPLGLTWYCLGAFQDMQLVEVLFCWNTPDPVDKEIGGGLEGGGGPSVKPESITKDQTVLDRLYCLWKASGYGTRDIERTTWITQAGAGYGFVPWPSSAAWHRDEWKGPIPANSVALAHTHPNSQSPKPSSGGDRSNPKDDFTANDTGLPNYVVTRDAIWKQVPGQKDPEQVAATDWWKSSEQREKNGGLKCP
jgi:RHS repeat-associated protein